MTIPNHYFCGCHLCRNTVPFDPTTYMNAQGDKLSKAIRKELMAIYDSLEVAVEKAGHRFDPTRGIEIARENLVRDIRELLCRLDVGSPRAIACLTALVLLNGEK